MDDLTLHSAHFEDGVIDMSLSGEQASIFMASLIQLFKQNGGDNFLTVTFEGKEEKYAITIQNCNGELTPAEKLQELKVAKELRPIGEWGEDYGDCLWWKLPIEEPPYCGSPLDCDFPEYVTHFTRLIMPTLAK